MGNRPLQSGDTRAPIVIQDRGRGFEIAGTRITVYNLLPSFLDPTVIEAEICHVYGLSLEQLAAARAYELRNPETVLAQHLKIEQKMAAGNPPEVSQRAEQARSTFKTFKSWLAESEAAESEREEATFEDWAGNSPTAESGQDEARVSRSGSRRSVSGCRKKRSIERWSAGCPSCWPTLTFTDTCLI